MQESITPTKVQHHCDECGLDTDQVFCFEHGENKRYLDSYMVTATYLKGDTLYMQGQHADGVYILRKGRVKLFTTSRDGKIIILQIAEPGEYLGLSASMLQKLHIASAEAIEDCEVCFISNRAFVNFLRDDAESCLRAINQLSQNFEKANKRICSLGLSSTVGDKLGVLLLSWCDEQTKESKNIRLNVAYTHEEIAQMIGASRETVTRMLKSFTDRKLLKFKGSRYFIFDKAKLEQAIHSSA
ncbi:MAG: Crp/Fnr family transcriptional regulator [Pyrinomonadaceae bacterium]